LLLELFSPALMTTSKNPLTSPRWLRHTKKAQTQICLDFFNRSLETASSVGLNSSISRQVMTGKVQEDIFAILKGLSSKPRWNYRFWM